ncbi:uncharacterized protein J4E79_009359 [Alternaria viburni]|uniref:uncharacterized protein n=1 Tax=Alternaria viburni TaxID=566460 RepID=UPI0020C2E5D8|nr:uncharacterized protein J4E79_009359 [Alternaria viburni]KAI4651160.1 hypothetical protein J4E79_009359 [Alternaria viburni]
MDEHNTAQKPRKRKASNPDPAPPRTHHVIEHYKPLPYEKSYGLMGRCRICPEKKNLIICSDCNAMFYCSSEHQALNKKTHQTLCDRLQELHGLIAGSEDALKRNSGDAGTPKDPFRTAGGRFWEYEATREYMYRRRDLLYELYSVNTTAAVQQALDEAFALLQLDSADHLQMRCLVPWLLLRLKRDQDCYDFCKWWVTKGTSEEHDWTSETLPLVGEDAFESLEVFERIREPGSTAPASESFTFLLAILLVKLRMVYEMKFQKHGKTSTEVKDSKSAIILSIVDSRVKEEWIPLIQSVENQARTLYRAVAGANKHFWPAFLNRADDGLEDAPPESAGVGDEAEMKIKLRECMNAWLESLGAEGLVSDMEMGMDHEPWWCSNRE